MLFYCVRYLKLKTNADVLQIPSSNEDFPIEIIPDSSKVAIGGVLLQDQGRGMRPCWFWSQRLSDAESSKSPYELELNALVALLKAWKPYLVGRKFTIRTDHAPLKAIPKQVKLTDKIIRQLDFLSEFRFDVVHIPGKENTASDGLSRRPDHYWNEDGTRRFSTEALDESDDTDVETSSRDGILYARMREMSPYDLALFLLYELQLVSDRTRTLNRTQTEPEP